MSQEPTPAQPGPESADRIFFEGQLTAQDVAEATKLHYRPRKPALVIFLALAAVAVLLFFLLVLPIVVGDFEILLSAGIPLVMLGAFWAFLIWWAVRLASKRQIAGSPFHQGPVKGWISRWGLEFGGEHWLSRFSWQMLLKTKSSDEMVLLYQLVSGFVILPRRFFSSAEDWETVRGWAKTYETTELSSRDRNTARRNLLILFAFLVALIVLVSALNLYFAAR